MRIFQNFSHLEITHRQSQENTFKVFISSQSLPDGFSSIFRASWMKNIHKLRSKIEIIITEIQNTKLVCTNAIRRDDGHKNFKVRKL